VPMLRGIALALVLAILGTSPARGQADVAGSKDHPLVSRMPGYYIDSYEAKDFDSFDPTVIGGPEVHWEGKKYTISYSQKEGAPAVSMLQVIRNYERALKSAGARVLGGDDRRTATELRKGGAMTGVYVEAFNGGSNYVVTIIETQAMTQEVTVDAAAMGRDLASSGKAVIYGIHFDTGSAVIKDDSEPTLAEMVKLLKATPTLKVHIVGHTDNVGLLAANLKLSAARGAALVKALAGRGIAAARLKSAGVGPYCPVASNAAEAGRKLNRRVELVEQ
jgi:OmpA-OmpF porin, OOP family